MADFSKFDYDTYTLVIPRVKDIKLEVNGLYIIKIDKALMGSSMFNMNWNKGMPPISEYLQADITNMMSQVMRCNCLDYDPEAKKAGTRVWSGWLPLNGVTVIEKL